MAARGRTGDMIRTCASALLPWLAACATATAPSRPTLRPEGAEPPPTATDLARAPPFFVGGLAFRPAGRGRLALGEEAVALEADGAAGRPIPDDSRSNDL